MTKELREQIEACLESVMVPGSPENLRFLAAREKWHKLAAPLLEAVAESEKLTEDDFLIRVNVRE